MSDKILKQGKPNCDHFPILGALSCWITHEKTNNKWIVKECTKCGEIRAMRRAQNSTASKIDDLSPEEVLAGVQHGGVNEFPNESQKDWGQEHVEEVAAAKELLQ